MGVDQGFEDDAIDRRTALDAAVAAVGNEPFGAEKKIILYANLFYAWLRQRDTLKVNLTITAGPVTDQEPGE